MPHHTPEDRIRAALGAQPTEETPEDRIRRALGLESQPTPEPEGDIFTQFGPPPQRFEAEPIDLSAAPRVEPTAPPILQERISDIGTPPEEGTLLGSLGPTGPLAGLETAGDLFNLAVRTPGQYLGNLASQQAEQLQPGRASQPLELGINPNLAEFEQRPLSEQIVLESVFDPTNFLPGVGVISRGPGSARQSFRAAPAIAKTLDVAEDVAPAAARAAQDTPVSRLTSLIREAKPIRAETTAMRSAELGRRSAAAESILRAGEGREAFRAARGPLRGSLPTAQFTPPESGLAQTDITGLYNTIRDSDRLFFQKLNTEEALTKVLTGQLPTPSDIRLLEDMFGPELAQAVLSKRTLGSRFMDNALDAVNLPRSVITSYDISAPLRQGAVLAYGHPIKGADSFLTMMKALVKEKNARHAESAILNHPNFQLFSDHGLFFAERGAVTGRLARTEEVFMSRLAGKIPGIKASERAYTTFLNKLRFDVMNGVYSNWLRQGKNVTDADLTNLANLVNAASGRGRLPKRLDRLAPALNAGFFSARYQASRVDLISQYGRALLSNDPMLRGEVIRQMVAFFGLGSAILGGLKMAGVIDLEENPLSSDFGKFRFKGTKTRLDFWAGFQPYARYMAQIIANKSKSVQTGEVRNLSQRDTFGRVRSPQAQRQTTFAEREITPRLGTAARFGRSKLSPPVSLLIDAGTGRNFTGEEFGASREFFGHEIPGLPAETYERMVPLFLQDVTEAVDEDGLTGGFIAAPGILGAGVVTIPEDQPTPTSRSTLR